MSAQPSIDPHAQLRALYISLLDNHAHFEEFKRLLALYDVKPDQLDEEPEDARAVRELLNTKISGWLRGDFDGLSAVQTLQWRVILVEERFNVALSPWKESNMW